MQVDQKRRKSLAQQAMEETEADWGAAAGNDDDGQIHAATTVRETRRVNKKHPQMTSLTMELLLVPMKRSMEWGRTERMRMISLGTIYS